MNQKLPEQPLIFVGGSGFYFQALDKGMFDVDPVDGKTVKRVEDLAKEYGNVGLYKELFQQDPDYANKIGPNDSYRLFRGLSLVLSEKKTMAQIESEFQQKREKKALSVPKIKLGLRCSKGFLRKRIELRVEKMLKKGLIGEVEGLLRQSQVSDWPPLRSVGYKEVIEYLKEPRSDLWLKEEIVKNTMRLAKKQMTWFQRDSEIHWFDIETGFQEPLSFLLKSL